jgi:hypothetical protein
MRDLERRVKCMEAAVAPALPWHTPPERRPDAALLAVAAPARASVADAELAAIVAGGGTQNFVGLAHARILRETG